MKITVNGNIEDISPGSLHAYLNGKGLRMNSVVVEYNYHIVKKDEWRRIELKENDQLEILSFVGGG